MHPVVWQYWEENKVSIQATASKNVKLMGDGQFDSPIYSMQFCFNRKVGYKECHGNWVGDYS
jgi:hypothetical protein